MFKDDRDSAEQSIMWFIIFSLFVILIFSMDVEASEDGRLIDLEIQYLIRKAPNHRLHNDEIRWAFLDSLIDVAARRRIPESLLLAVSFLESSLDTHRIGTRRNEIGLMQVHGVAAMGCDLSTEYGQLDCGAKWLSLCKDKCGTWRGALTAYAIGECKTNSKTVKKMVEYRLKFWEKTKKHTGDDQ